MSESPFSLHLGEDGIATLTFDNPGERHNVMNRKNLAQFQSVVEDLSTHAGIEILIFRSAKENNFCVGFDVMDIAAVEDKDMAAKVSGTGQEIYSAWENLPFPTVAAVNGTCLGGGCELALASTWIVVSNNPQLRIGLPETRLGIIPGWGGCVRLPRRIGIADALGIILAGRAIPARSAFKKGLADAMLPEATFDQEVRAFAEAHKGKKRGQSGRNLKEQLLEGNALGRKVVFDQARKKTMDSTGGHYPAPLRAIEIIKLSVEEGPEAGYAAEVRAVADLVTGPVCKHLVKLFLMMERAKKVPAFEVADALELEEVAVLGAGVMGGGIAQLTVDKCDLPVRLKDINSEALASGLAHAAKLYDKRVRKRRMRRSEARRKMSLISPTLNYDGFSRCNLLVEAVVENLGLKQNLFAEIAGIMPEDSVLATNTSSLSVDAIAHKTPNPERVVGMHFFNPVHRMPLVEVVVGKRTSPRATNTILALSRKMGKTPVIVKDAPGFLVNRLLGFYMVEALWLLEEGHRMDVIDNTMKAWGMPMGPFVLLDEVGLDVAMKVAHILEEAFPDRLTSPAWANYLQEGDRLGKKVGKGLYRYDRNKKKLGPDSRVYTNLGLTPEIDEVEPVAIVERLLLPVLNEAARCLEEEVVESPTHLDLAMILGTGFPPFRGGLCRWADHHGLEGLLQESERLAERHGARFQPSEPFAQAAAAGGFYSLWGELEGLVEERNPTDGLD